VRVFEKKLDGRFHKKDRYLFRYAAAIAASVVIFVSASIYVYVKNSEGYTGAIETSQWIEFKEAEQYYSMQTDDAVAKLKETLVAQPKDISSPLFNELEDMEDSYKQLKKDLKDNPNDIRLMSAVVQYHQMKLDLINNLIERFTLYSNTKSKKHEKSNI
jgi:cytochrome c-type biogenesis protein CcmH/NrfG